LSRFWEALTLPGSAGQLLLALFPPQSSLLLLLLAAFVLLDRLLKLITEILEDLETLLQPEGGRVVAEELGQLEAQGLHLFHARLQDG